MLLRGLHLEVKLFTLRVNAYNTVFTSYCKLFKNIFRYCELHDTILKKKRQQNNFNTLLLP